MILARRACVDGVEAAEWIGERVGLVELERVVRLRLDVHADHIEPGAVVERSIIGFGARIGPRALIRDGVIGDGADIGARCELLRGARVWPGVPIPDCGIRYSSDI